jgi:hypothetical protein
MGELEAMFLTLFVEGTLGVNERIWAAQTCAGVAKNVQIHNLFTFYRMSVSEW